MLKLMAGALLALTLGVACEPTLHSHADVLRIDCTQFGWFSVQVSSPGHAELRTGTGEMVARVTDPDVQRVTVRDWHPVRGGHIKELHITAGDYRSPASTTPLCGVVLKPEASDV